MLPVAHSSFDKEAEEIFDLYKAGEVSFNEYAEFIRVHTDNLIKFYIRQMGATKNNVSFDDVFNEARLEVLRCISPYSDMSEKSQFNPHLGTISSYFSRRIKTAIMDFISPSHMTRHYVTFSRKLEKCAKENGFDGLMDPSLDSFTLADISGISIDTVMRCREANDVSVVSTETLTEDSSFGETGSPEDAVLMGEKNEMLRKALSKLTDYEKWLVISVADEGKTFNSLLRFLNTNKEAKELLAPGETLSVDSMEKTYNRALSKMRQDYGLKKYYHVEPHVDTNIEIQIQASETDITVSIRDIK